jgi:hypothetical protein
MTQHQWTNPWSLTATPGVALTHHHLGSHSRWPSKEENNLEPIQKKKKENS